MMISGSHELARKKKVPKLQLLSLSVVESTMSLTATRSTLSSSFSLLSLSHSHISISLSPPKNHAVSLSSSSSSLLPTLITRFRFTPKKRRSKKTKLMRFDQSLIVRLLGFSS
ncbi:hypothetical protein S83_028808 [Arachis hypogaea]